MTQTRGPIRTPFPTRSSRSGRRWAGVLYRWLEGCVLVIPDPVGARSHTTLICSVTGDAVIVSN
ncbi:hypothetical protein J3E61_006917 [Mycobacterium sp. OAE908]